MSPLPKESTHPHPWGPSLKTIHPVFVSADRVVLMGTNSSLSLATATDPVPVLPLWRRPCQAPELSERQVQGTLSLLYLHSAGYNYFTSARWWRGFGAAEVRGGWRGGVAGGVGWEPRLGEGGRWEPGERVCVCERVPGDGGSIRQRCSRQGKEQVWRGRSSLLTRRCDAGAVVATIPVSLSCFLRPLRDDRVTRRTARAPLLFVFTSRYPLCPHGEVHSVTVFTSRYPFVHMVKSIA